MNSNELATWSRATFRIATDRGLATVDGIVRGPLGIHLQLSSSTPNFSVTHLASGYRVHGDGWFTTLGQAFDFATRVVILDCQWHEPTQALTPEQCEAIAQIAKAVRDA